MAKNFDPEWRGPTGYRSKKRKVIPNRRHWYRGFWVNLNPAPVTIQFTDKQMDKLTRRELLDRAYARI